MPEEKTPSQTFLDLIEKQQKEIDTLKASIRASNERWVSHWKEVDQLAMWAFSVLNHHESPECHFELKKALITMGYCPRCEYRPCECDSEGY